MSPEVVCRHLMTEEGKVSLSSINFDALDYKPFLTYIHQFLTPECKLFNDLQAQQLVQIISRLSIIREEEEEALRIKYLIKFLDKMLVEAENEYLQSIITDRNLVEHIKLIREITICYSKNLNSLIKQHCENLIPKILFTLLDRLKSVRSDYNIDKLIELYKAINVFGKIYFENFLEFISYYITHAYKISCIVIKIFNYGITALNRAVMVSLPSVYPKIQSYSELKSLCMLEFLQDHIRDNITRILSGKKVFLSIDESIHICHLLKIDKSSAEAYKAIQEVTHRIPAECSGEHKTPTGLYACALNW